MNSPIAEKDEEHKSEGIDSSAKIWHAYVTEAEKVDKALAQKCKGDMDGILIFAGLFSAILTAFLIESYKNLQPDSDNKTIVLLTQISQQLANGSYPATFPPPDLDAPFKPPMSAVICNALWFSSLGFSLSCALTATLVQQWSQNYMQAAEQCLAEHRRARIRAYLFRGLQRFNMPTVVEAIPLLLHVALFLFFAGLVEFLLPVNWMIGCLVSGMLGTSASIYSGFTLLPLFFSDCPYRTPVSEWCWRILRAVRRYREGKRFALRDMTSQETMTHVRDTDAVRGSADRDARDRDIICWTMEEMYSRDEAKLLTFLDGLHGEQDFYVRLLDDVFPLLGNRITQIINRCCRTSRQRDRAARVQNCAKVLIFITTLRGSSRKARKIWLGFGTLEALSEFSGIDDGNHCKEAAIKVFWYLLREFMDTATLLETHLNEMISLAADNPEGLVPWTQGRLGDLQGSMDDVSRELALGWSVLESIPSTKFPWKGIAMSVKEILPLYEQSISSANALFSRVEGGLPSVMAPLTAEIEKVLRQCQAVLRSLYDARVRLMIDDPIPAVSIFNCRWDSIETMPEVYRLGISPAAQEDVLLAMDQYRMKIPQKSKFTEALDNRLTFVLRLVIHTITDPLIVKKAIEAIKPLKSANGTAKSAWDKLYERIGEEPPKPTPHKRTLTRKVKHGSPDDDDDDDDPFQ